MNATADEAPAAERLADLDAAVRAHHAWFAHVARVLAGETAPDPDTESGTEAEQHCTFGRWLEANPDLVTGPPGGVARLPRLHRDLHRRVRLVLEQLAAGEAPGDADQADILTTAQSITELMGVLRRGLWHRLAPRDAETGLADPDGMTAQLADLFADWTAARPRSLALVSLSGLEAVETAHGPAGRAEVLAFVGRFLRTGLRPDDAAYRHGTTTALLVFDGLPEEAAAAIVAPLCSRLGGERIMLSDGGVVGIGVEAACAPLSGADSLAPAIALAARRLTERAL